MQGTEQLAALLKHCTFVSAIEMGGRLLLHKCPAFLYMCEQAYMAEQEAFEALLDIDGFSIGGGSCMHSEHMLAGWWFNEAVMYM